MLDDDLQGFLLVRFKVPDSHLVVVVIFRIVGRFDLNGVVMDHIAYNLSALKYYSECFTG